MPRKKDVSRSLGSTGRAFVKSRGAGRKSAKQTRIAPASFVSTTGELSPLVDDSCSRSDGSINITSGRSSNTDSSTASVRFQPVGDRPIELDSSDSGTLAMATGISQSQGLGVHDFSQFIAPQPIVLSQDNLGSIIPQNIKEKIWKNEYVELGILTKGLRQETYDNKPVGLMGLNAQGGIEVIRRNYPRINTIKEWTDAFLIFVSIYLEKFGDKTQHMLKYMNIVRMAATRMKGYGWRSYDQQFRLRHAHNPHEPWSVINNELWLMFATPSSSVSINPMNPYYRQGQGQGQDVKPNMRAKRQLPCYDFNLTKCSRSVCRYAHVCTSCSKPHPSRLCKNMSKLAHVNSPNGKAT
ncbi:uncharacterized protein LOC124131726 [Haliotis rufescens]|uniref:uncharacterized protein LOC124131726 n=1 Tax=Haliotis rufescens TaxID=6454 RepID=UPI00201EB13D|nr:uncharacterized protein LOC124131726 [Haliotis rufescens]